MPAVSNSVGFSPSTAPAMPSAAGSQSATMVPITLFQLQQLQAAQQQAARQQNLQMNPMVPGIIPANQFFVSTTTAHAAAPTMQQASQLAAIQQQAALTANANVPILISDPNIYMQAVQQNALMQQNARAMSFMQPFPILPPQVPGQTVPSNINIEPKPHVRMGMFSQPAPGESEVPIFPAPAMPSSDATAVVQAKLSTDQVSCQALLPPSVEASTTSVKTEGETQVAPKVVGPPTTVPNQVFLESSLQPFNREEDSPNSAEEDMWKYFFRSDEEGSNHNSEEAITSSIFDSDHNPSMTEATSEAVPSNVASSSEQPSAAAQTAEPLPTLSSLQKPILPKKGDSSKLVPARAECGKVKKPTLQPKQRTLPITFEFQGSPQEYLMAILKERGYSCDRIPNNQTGYQSKPTELELASFGTEVVKAVHSGDVAKLKALLDCGLSPSPCNAFGDYIVHLVCRRANFGILKCLVDHGCNLEVCDSFGRTPLHCVAWAGEFCKESAELIMDLHPSEIMVEDNRGQCPLEYVRKEQWPEWKAFLKNKMDTYWPIGGKPVQLSSSEAIKKHEPEPEISLELARNVAAGTISPSTVAAMDGPTRLYYGQQESLQSILFS